MAISPRKEKIIQAVVDSYIVSCEPISSAQIKNDYLPELSSATIRNELAALEEMGYLEQPHTSAGRIPTAEAYKLYVNKLMPRHRLTKSELKVMNSYFDRKITEIDDMLRSTAKMISEISGLTGVAMIPDLSGAVIESVKIVKLNSTSALVIIVTNLGVLKDAKIELNSDMPESYFIAASEFITDAFGGHTIGEVVEPDELIDGVKREYENLFRAIIDILEDYVSGGGVGDIVLEGSSKILDQPEYANVKKARAMLGMLEEKDRLLPMFKTQDGVDFSVRIGRENELAEGVPECAIVTMSYKVNGVSVGNAGVIGPIRMDYSKVLSVLDYVGKTINADEDKDKEQNDKK